MHPAGLTPTCHAASAILACAHLFFHFLVTGNDQTLLDIAEEHGIDVPWGERSKAAARLASAAASTAAAPASLPVPAEPGAVLPPSSPPGCRSGTCHSCCSRLLEGEVDQEEQAVLGEEDVSPCFSGQCVC